MEDNSKPNPTPQPGPVTRSMTGTENTAQHRAHTISITPITKRLLISLSVAILTLAIYYLQPPFVVKDSGDAGLPIAGSIALLQGNNPYKEFETIIYRDKPIALYPLTTLLLLLPFAPFGEVYGAKIFFSVSTGILVYAILTKRPTWYLWILLSGSFIMSFRHMQFSPLIAATYLLPSISPIAIIKPHNGILAVMLGLNKKRLAAIIGLIALSFIVLPTWLSDWWNSARNYDGFIPILFFPFGPLILLALLRCKHPQARFLLLYALLPQRGIYDLMPLLLFTRSKIELLTLCVLTIIGWRLDFMLFSTDGMFYPSMLIYLIFVAFLLLWPKNPPPQPQYVHPQT